MPRLKALGVTTLAWETERQTRLDDAMATARVLLRLIDMLERRGVISGYEGSKPRQVLISESDLPRLLGAGAREG